MASKEIKFNLRLAIDGKEHWVSAATTAKQLQGAIAGAKDETEKFQKKVFINSLQQIKREMKLQ